MGYSVVGGGADMMATSVSVRAYENVFDRPDSATIIGIPAGAAGTTTIGVRFAPPAAPGLDPMLFGSGSTELATRMITDQVSEAVHQACARDRWSPTTQLTEESWTFLCGYGGGARNNLCIDVGPVVRRPRPGLRTRAATASSRMHAILPPCPRPVYVEPETVAVGAPLADPERPVRLYGELVTPFVLRNAGLSPIRFEGTSGDWTDFRLAPVATRTGNIPNCDRTTPIAPDQACRLWLQATTRFESTTLTVLRLAYRSLDPGGAESMHVVPFGTSREIIYPRTGPISGCERVMFGGRTCQSVRVDFTGDARSDAYVARAQLHVQSGTFEPLQIRAGNLDAAPVTLPAYARADRPISLFVLRCDGMGIDPSEFYLDVQSNRSREQTQLHIRACPAP